MGDKIQFNPAIHLKDFDDLRGDISEKDSQTIAKVHKNLKFEFSESKKRYNIDYGDLSRHELLYPNLLSVQIPQNLYVADYNYEREKVIEDSWETSRPVGYKASERDVAKAAMHQKGYGFSNDWVIHNKQIITFHDLTNDNLPLAKIADLGTATRLRPEEYYQVNKDIENVFKNLLWRCLQHMLYKNGIQYQNEVSLFIFTAADDEDMREEECHHNKKSERTVFEKKMRQDKPDKIDVFQHFAFDTSFELLKDDWFMIVKPDWFFSYNGYKKSSKSADKVKYKKKKENNKQVYNHFNFISYYLRNIHEKQSDLFAKSNESGEIYFLKFEKDKPIDNAPNIDDKKWLEKELNERRNVFEQDQTEMVL